MEAVADAVADAHTHKRTTTSNTTDTISAAEWYVSGGGQLATECTTHTARCTLHTHTHKNSRALRMRTCFHCFYYRMTPESL